jgi:two-component system, cell cycle response regulator DivK
MYRILYIEDDLFSNRLVKKMLKPLGYNIIDAETALEGLYLAMEARPDVILMDVNLPDLAGTEVIRLLKQSALAHIPVIVLTNDITTRQACFEAGCDAYLNEPISATALQRVIVQITQNAHSA